MEAARFYMKYLFPLELVGRMMRAESLFGAAGGDGLEFFRELALVAPPKIWWHNRDKSVRTVEELRAEIERNGRVQVHFSTLHCSAPLGSAGGGAAALPDFFVREAVFDLDVTDFRRFCACGKEKKACGQCWLHLEGAALLLHYLLVARLGVEERRMLWVLSGKKGFHCLVNDARYMYMGVRQRENLLALLRLETPEALRRFAASLEPDFAALVLETFRSRALLARALLENEAYERHALELIRAQYPSLHGALSARWASASSASAGEEESLSLRKWNALLRLEELSSSAGAHDCPPSLLLALQCFYPVVDGKPMRLGQMFKLPFSVHCDTGRVGMPVERAELVSDTLPDSQLSVGALCAPLYAGATEPHPQFVRGLALFSQWLSRDQ